MKSSLLASTLAIASVAVAVPAGAATFSFDSSTIGGNSSVGVHERIQTTYDTETDWFTWSSTFSPNPANGNLADGAWLVVSPGPNPKSHAQEYVMFYLDGTVGNEQVSMYVYNGMNSSSSYVDNIYLGATDLQVEESGDERTFSFELDMTTINNLDIAAVNTDPTVTTDWVGTEFGEEVGIWFHGVEGLETAYNANGSLSDFSYSSQGWYDARNLPTEQVPEPGLAFGLGFAAFAA
ncbi:MAG: hypothetical protein AAFZ80_09065, partial [Cyanobacteria bacterium P01_A01_bin.105]